MRTSITWNGREVENRTGRVAVVVLAVLGACIGGLAAIVMLAVLTPLALLAHPILRLAARRGTIRYDSGRMHIGFDREAFSRG